jgi:hypothetical protein
MSPDDHIDFLARHFSAGHYDRLVDTYVFPLPIYVNQSAAVAASGRDVWAFFQSLHALMRASGFDRLSGRITSVELPRRGRFRLWVDWTGDGHAGARPLFRSICYNLGDLSAHRTEMITIEDISWPDLRQLVAAA